MVQESRLSSAEDVAAPRAVAAEKLKGRTIKMDMHSQVLRIRSEDLHLGEDIGVKQLTVFSRHILPASPLSGKTAS